MLAQTYLRLMLGTVDEVVALKHCFVRQSGAHDGWFVLCVGDRPGMISVVGCKILMIFRDSRLKTSGLIVKVRAEGQLSRFRSGHVCPFIPPSPPFMHLSYPAPTRLS